MYNTILHFPDFSYPVRRAGQDDVKVTRTVDLQVEEELYVCVYIHAYYSHA
jgi:hypothetical protein